MLEVDKFPAEYLSRFTGQVNNWLGEMIRSKRIPDASSYHLGENFLMLFLNNPELHAINSLDRDVSELATPTGRRHYQIKTDKGAIAYARSCIDENESICQLFATKLACNVEKAIAALDDYERNHPEFASERWRVRMITIPTFHAHAFLIQRIQNDDDEATGGSYLYVISAPPRLNNLPRGKLLNSRQFLLGFKGERPIVGVSQPQNEKERIDMATKKGAKAKTAMTGYQRAGGQSSTALAGPPGKSPAIAGGEGHSNIGGELGRPIFASLIYPVTNDHPGLGGGGGHIGALGGPPEGVDPIFVMFTYPVPPKKKLQKIDELGNTLPVNEQ
jgi:hypothetical protein